MLEVSPIVHTGNEGTKTCRRALKLCTISVHPGLIEFEPDGGTHMVSHSLSSRVIVVGFILVTALSAIFLILISLEYRGFYNKHFVLKLQVII